MTIGIEHYLIVGALLFAIGLFIVLAKRNLIGAFMGVELMLNAVNLTFIAFARFTESAQPITGQVFAVFVITVAAGEAALALALAVAVYRTRASIDAEDMNTLKW